MSDPLNALPKSGRRIVDDPPDSPASVGMTHAQTVRLADASNPLPLDKGDSLDEVIVEYETYGELSPAKDNAVLICHALSGDAHAAGWDAEASESHRAWRQKHPGWWDSMIGPTKPFDTSRYFVICSNVLGGCYGTTGPSSLNPKTGKPYNMDFPVVTVSDWVRLQERLINHLGIEKLLAVAGGSLGGQQAIEWSIAYPDRLRSAIILAASPRLSAQGLGWNTVARQAIVSDPNFNGGNYTNGNTPDRGLAAARMIGHITYLSEMAMAEKFGRRLQDRQAPGFHFDVDFEVESYLTYQGKAFTQRFDANSYLLITKAMDYYDAAQWGDGDLVAAAARTRCRSLVISFTSDWLYTPAMCREWVNALCRNRRQVSYVNIPSSYGHDAFLLELDTEGRMIRSFLKEALENG